LRCRRRERLEQPVEVLRPLAVLDWRQRAGGPDRLERLAINRFREAGRR
jgi:hypothetical protein